MLFILWKVLGKMCFCLRKTPFFRMGTGECVLGIDIGTTSVKCCLVDVRTKELIASQKKDTCADVPSELGKCGK